MNTKRIVATVLGLTLFAPFVASAQPVDRAPVRVDNAATTTREKVQNAVQRADSALKNVSDRVVKAQDRAEEELDRRIAKLRALIARLESAGRISDEFKRELYALIEEQISNLESLRTRIADSVSTSTLKNEIKSVTGSYRIFALVMQQAQIAAAAERIVTMTATMSEIGAKLNARVNELAASGVDTTRLDEALSNLAEHIDAANTHARAAVAGTADLEPDNGNAAVAEANRAALKAAREELRLARAEVQAGREEIRTIIDALKNLRTRADTDVETEHSADTQ